MKTALHQSLTFWFGFLIAAAVFTWANYFLLFSPVYVQSSNGMIELSITRSLEENAPLLFLIVEGLAVLVAALWLGLLFWLGARGGDGALFLPPVDPPPYFLFAHEVALGFLLV